MTFSHLIDELRFREQTDRQQPAVRREVARMGLQAEDE